MGSSEQIEELWVVCGLYTERWSSDAIGWRRFRLEKRSGLLRRASSPLKIFFISKCRQDINKLNFIRNTKFSNLFSEERTALENLSKHKDITVKAADKGGALVVWRADLYQKALLCGNFFDSSFYA